MQHQSLFALILSTPTLPFCGPDKATPAEQRSEDAVLVVCAIFYSCVVLFGFRNVYVVLWQQQKYKFYFLSLIYLFG